MVKYLTHQIHLIYLLFMVPLIDEGGVRPDSPRYHKMTKPAESLEQVLCHLFRTTAALNLYPHHHITLGI
jgi:hypothetical protein